MNGSKCVLLFLSIVSLIAMGFGQAIPFAFESAVCSGGTCEFKAGCGRSGGSCISLSSTTSSITQLVVTMKTVLTVGSDWLMTAYVKCTGNSGDPLFSLGNSNVGAISDGEIDVGNGWIRHTFFARMYGGNSWRVGATSLDGTCLFDEVTLSPAIVKDVSFGIYGQMGHGERVLENGTYIATFGEGSYTNDYYRYVIPSTYSWNGNCFRVYDKTVVNLKHELSTPFLTAPNVTFTLSYGTGSLMLESSIDGSNWVFISNTTGLVKVSSTLPSSSHIHVRFSAFGGAAYVSEYEFRSKVLSSTSGIYNGKEVILSTDSIAHLSTANLSVSMQNPVFNEGSQSSITLTFSESSSSTQSIQSGKFLITSGHSLLKINLPSNSITLSPGGTSSITFNYHCSGLKWHFAEFSLVSSDSLVTYLTGRIFFKPDHFLLDSSYGKLLQTTASSSLWISDPTHQIYKYRSAPTTLASTISISAARNEKEPFQLVLRSKSSPITINSISISDLVNGTKKVLSSTSISIRRVLYILTTRGVGKYFNPYSLFGAEWPDALIPLDLPYICPANTNCPFWVLISIGPNVTEGDYKASVSVTTSTGTLSSTISLHVFNFSIPKFSRFKSLAAVSMNDIYLYHNLTNANSTMKEMQYNLYLKDLSEHRLSPNKPLYFYSINDKLIYQNGVEHWQFNTYKYNAVYKRYFGPESEYGFTYMNMNLAGLSNMNSDHVETNATIKGLAGQIYKWGDANFTRLFNEYALLLQNYLESINLLQHANLYWMDEPATWQYERIRTVNRAVHNAAPKITRFLTEVPTSELFGFVDTWCIPYSGVDPQTVKSRQGVGEKIWEYKGLQLDFPITEPRIWLWQLFRDGALGFLHWSLNRWTNTERFNGTLQDTYSDPLTYCSLNDVHGREYYGNGEARLWYPPVNYKTAKGSIISTPIDTLRIENLREGLEDWEYLKTLSDVLEIRPNLPSEIRERAINLLQVPASIVNVMDWTSDPTEMIERREQIGKILEEINLTPDDPTLSESDNQQANKSTPLSIHFLLHFIMITCVLLF